MSYSPDFDEIARRGAHFVDRILRGAAPADLPIEQPTTYQLVINLKTAKTLGLTIPPTLLARGGCSSHQRLSELAEPRETHERGRPLSAG